MIEHIAHVAVLFVIVLGSTTLFCWISGWGIK